MSWLEAAREGGEWVEPSGDSLLLACMGSGVLMDVGKVGRKFEVRTQRFPYICTCIEFSLGHVAVPAGLTLAPI